MIRDSYFNRKRVFYYRLNQRRLEGNSKVKLSIISLSWAQSTLASPPILEIINFNFFLFIMSAKGKKVAMPEGDAERGAKIFEKECSVCHSKEEMNDKSNAAPHLSKILNRPSASTQFPFSNAMKKSKKVWNAENLYKYLEAPAKFVPGNKMSYGGVKDKQQRADLVAYLSTL